MHLFYTPDIQKTAGSYQLDEQESRHCMRVLRLKVGDAVVLMDGKGHWYDAIIATEHKNKVLVQIEKVYAPYAEKKHYIHLAVAPTKNIDRYEWFLEKATEIGVDVVTPIICSRSERKEVKIERLEKIITAAVKQSLKSYHPVLKDAMIFRQFISQDFAGYDFQAMAHCINNTKKVTILNGTNAAQKYLILIGPEGDFTPDEIALATQKGFVPLSLGEARLRTETAALFACFQLNQLQW